MIEGQPRRFRNLADEYAFQIAQLKNEILYQESKYRKLKTEYNKLVERSQRVIMRVK